MRRILSALLALAVGVALVPFVLFEVMVAVDGQPRQWPPLHDPGIPALAVDALWMASGEHLGDAALEPMWFGNLACSFRRRPGHRAGWAGAAWVGRELAYREAPQLRMVPLHLLSLRREAWLTRHATASELKRVLVERRYFGRQAFGFEAGARAWFGRHPSDLSVAEIAFLVSRSRRTFGNPICNPAATRGKVSTELELMKKVGLIDTREHAAAVNSPLVFTPTNEICPSSVGKDAPAHEIQHAMRSERVAEPE